MEKNVVIIDDSVYMRTLIRSALENGGHHVVGEAADGASAMSLITEKNPDLITLDNVLPDMYGLDVLREINNQDISVKAIMISAVGQKTVRSTAQKLGAFGYLVKPFSEKDLLESIDSIFKE